MEETKTPTVADRPGGRSASSPYLIGPAPGCVLVALGVLAATLVPFVFDALGRSRSQDDEHRRTRSAHAVQSWQLRQLLPRTAAQLDVSASHRRARDTA